MNTSVLVASYGTQDSTATINYMYWAFWQVCRANEDDNFTNVKRNTTMDTIPRPRRESKGSPTNCVRNIDQTLRIINSQRSRVIHLYRLNMSVNRTTLHITQHSKRTRQTWAGVARIELFTVHITTPPPMHMHSVAPNRLQDALCNLWRLHISHCQHTQTH